MAHFARLDSSSIVTKVVVVSNNVLIGTSGQEVEQLGIDFLTETFGWSDWRQTSYSASFRKHFAGIGYFYDSVLDAFIPPKPYASWLLNTSECIWEPPIPMPNDGKLYFWNEAKGDWDPVS